MKHLIFGILFYIVVLILTVVITENLIDREINKKPLYDIVHMNTIPFPKPYVPNYLLYFFILYTIIRWGFVDFKIITLYFLSLAGILLMRLFAFTITQTPPPRKLDSSWRIDHCKRNILNSFGISFKKMGDSCIDNMFSGHAAHIVVAVTIILIYSKYAIEKIVFVLLGLLSLITIVTTRLHYSSDVIISTFISSLFVYFVSKIL